jgi:hypothetical protein
MLAKTVVTVFVGVWGEAVAFGAVFVASVVAQEYIEALIGQHVSHRFGFFVDYPSI